jgi:hypothetical protein
MLLEHENTYKSLTEVNLDKTFSAEVFLAGCVVPFM